MAPAVSTARAGLIQRATSTAPSASASSSSSLGIWLNGGTGRVANSHEASLFEILQSKAMVRLRALNLRKEDPYKNRKVTVGWDGSHYYIGVSGELGAHAITGIGGDGEARYLRVQNEIEDVEQTLRHEVSNCAEVRALAVIKSWGVNPSSVTIATFTENGLVDPCAHCSQWVTGSYGKVFITGPGLSWVQSHHS
jgi:hypothetical protein